MSGSTIGGVVGGVIGFYVGGPAGAQWGWMIGSAVGSVVDPTQIKGPKLTDPQQQTASEGAPIPLIYGQGGVLGTIIQCQSEPTEHKHKESTGKGGPEQITYTYTRTVAIAICRAAPLGGTNMLRRAWVNGKLAYDATGSGTLDVESTKFLAGMTFYPGSETQLPDPDLEALPAGDGGGVGNVPAYRGLCYAVLPDCDVTQSGGTVPVIKWEIVSHGTETTADAAAPLWIATNGSGKFQTSSGTNWTANAAYTASATGRHIRYANGRVLCSDNTDQKYSDDKGATWNTTTITSGTIPFTTGPSTSVNGNDFWVADRPWKGGGASLSPAASLGAITPPAFGAGFAICGYVNGYVWVSTDEFATSNDVNLSLGDDVTVAISNGSRVLVVAENGGTARYTNDGVSWSSPYTIPGHLGNMVCGAASGNVFVVGAKYNLTTGAVIWVSTDQGATFTQITLPEIFYVYDIQIGGGLIVAVGEKNKLAGTPRIWTAPLDDPTTWTSRTNNFTTSDAITGIAYMGCGAGFPIPDAPGMTVHRDGTICQDYETHTVTPDGVDLADLVGDLIERGLVTDYDVSALAGTTVAGFTISQPTTSGAAIAELRQFYFFDLPEWGNSGDAYVKIRAVPRGGSNVFAFSDDGDDSPILDTDDDLDTRPQAVEYARVVNVIASDPDHAYEPIKQTSERYSENIKASSEISLSTAILFDRNELAQRADIFQKIQWTEANGNIVRTLPEEYTVHTIGDCGTVNGKRYRIDKIAQQYGSSQWTLTRDRPSAYSSSATGSDGVAVPTPVGGTLGPTVFQALNLSSLSSKDNVPGMYIFVCGMYPAWQGCDLYMIVEGVESLVATIINPATMGWLTADLETGTGGTTLSVQLYNTDELDDATTDQLAARMNACAVTTDGVSEILQFADATSTGTKTYDLTTLTRALLGTTEADHFQDDDFAMLDGSQYFLPLDVSLAGKTITFRPVTRGTVPANNQTYDVVFEPPTFVIDGGEVT